LLMLLFDKWLESVRVKLEVSTVSI